MLKSVRKCWYLGGQTLYKLVPGRSKYVGGGSWCEKPLLDIGFPCILAKAALSSHTSAQCSPHLLTFTGRSTGVTQASVLGQGVA